jgi:hypothetical protein
LAISSVGITAIEVPSELPLYIFVAVLDGAYGQKSVSLEETPQSSERVLEFAGAGCQIGDEVGELAKVTPGNRGRPVAVEYAQAFIESPHRPVCILAGFGKFRSRHNILERSLVPIRCTHRCEAVTEEI